MKLMSTSFRLKSFKNSLPHRFNLFLVTAFPVFFGKVQAHRNLFLLFFLKFTASQELIWRNRPCFLNSRISALRLRDGKSLSTCCDSQTPSPLGSSSWNYFPSISCRHAYTKSMGGFSPFSFGLISSFHVHLIYNLNICPCWFFQETFLDHKALNRSRLLILYADIAKNCGKLFRRSCGK